MRYITLDKIMSSYPDSVLKDIICSFHCCVEPHYHNYFEMTFVLQGAVDYTINEVPGVLNKCELLLLRPGDKHIKSENKHTKLVNISFSKEIFESLSSYLGNDYHISQLLTPKMSPIITLSEYDISQFKQKIKHFYTSYTLKQRASETEIKIIIMELIAKFCSALYNETEKQLPQWMEKVINEMSKTENFTVGISALSKISGKTQTTICRAFSTYLGITPTDYINKLRLEYCRELLGTTNESITTIAFMSGFDSLSHFYHRFKTAYQITPKQYRDHFQNKSALEITF